MVKVLIVICGAFSLATASAQTASELADKYVNHEVYDVQPGVQMTAKFAPDGLVCEMQIEQVHFGKDAVNLSDGIEKERVNGLVDQLVSPLERGEKDPDPKHNMTHVIGQVMESVQTYSNVTVDVLSSVPHDTTVIEIRWRHRTC
jgi:hypothetical protein